MTKVKKLVLWTAAVAVLAAGAWAIHRAADGRAVETGALPVAQVERRDIDVVAEALRDDAASARAVAPELEGRLQVEAGTANASLSVVGSWPSYFGVNNFRFAEGRVFTEAEDRGRRRVAVAGALAGEALGVGPSAPHLGETVRIGGVPFLVIGVLAERGGMGFSNPDEGIFIRSAPPSSG